jgi:hypothetical protein
MDLLKEPGCEVQSSQGWWVTGPYSPRFLLVLVVDLIPAPPPVGSGLWPRIPVHTAPQPALGVDKFQQNKFSVQSLYIPDETEAQRGALELSVEQSQNHRGPEQHQGRRGRQRPGGGSRKAEVPGEAGPGGLEAARVGHG